MEKPETILPLDNAIKWFEYVEGEIEKREKSGKRKMYAGLMDDMTLYDVQLQKKLVLRLKEEIEGWIEKEEILCREELGKDPSGNNCLECGIKDCPVSIVLGTLSTVLCGETG